MATGMPDGSLSAVPSRTDLERNYSADVMNLIISLAGSDPVARAWWLRDDGFTEADWIIV